MQFEHPEADRQLVKDNGATVGYFKASNTNVPLFAGNPHF
jgi:hypothetical protein